tara:strand:+ start:344 stop:526 length:183 start_codon:yes stop_codon:yes gene_type:complete
MTIERLFRVYAMRQRIAHLKKKLAKRGGRIDKKIPREELAMLENQVWLSQPWVFGEKSGE